jgi:hypothetical protein
MTARKIEVRRPIVEPVLYRWTEIRAKEKVYICECERDADNLGKIGFTTTCVPRHEVTGHRGTWFDSFNPEFDRKIVIIIPNDDDNGRQRAQHIKLKLGGFAASVAIIKLPNPDQIEGYSVSDFIAGARSRREAAQQLLALDRATEEYNRELDARGEPAEVIEIFKPSEIQKPESLEFPSRVMKGAAGRFAKEMSELLEPPPQFFYFSYLTALGTLLSPYLTSDSALPDQARLFTVLLGESGTTRKSTAINQVLRLFNEALGTYKKPKDPNIPGLNVIRGVGSAEGLQKRLQNLQGMEAVDSLEENLDDFVPQRVGCLLALDEFKSFVSKCSIQGSVLLETVNSLFEQNVSENSTKNRDVFIENAFLGLLTACTTGTYEQLLTTVFINIGFNNRLWLVPGTGKRKHAWVPTVPDELMRELKQDLLEVLRHVGIGTVGGINRCCYSIAKDAAERYEHWYHNEMDTSFHATRLDTYSKRLLLLLAANNLKDRVDLETVRDVIVLCNWQLKARRKYTPIDSENKMAAMEERIRRQLAREPMKSGKLSAAVHYKRYGTWVYQRALENLIKFGEVEKAGKMYLLVKQPTS